MKKWVSAFLACALLFSLAGCKKQAAEPAVEGTLEEIMARVYTASGLSELPNLGNVALTSENAASYLGAEVAITEGLASEALISAIPHSVCLVRLQDGADVTAVKKTILENANPNKWICVSVDPADVVVDSIGNLVILIMADGSEALHKGFLSLAH